MIEILKSYPESRTDRAWREFLFQSPFASHYTSPDYFREPAFIGGAPFAILVRDGAQVVGVATGVSQRGRVYCGTAGRPQVLCAAGYESELARGLQSIQRGGFLSVVGWGELGLSGFRCKQLGENAGNVLLDLSAGPEKLFSEFSQRQRTHARKALREGVTVKRVETEAEIREFYSIYCDWCAFKGFTPQPYEIHARMLALTEHRIAFAAFYQGEMIAVSTLRYHKGGVMEYAANNSRREDTKVRPNDLLMWTAIQWACANGMRYFSMGGSHFFLRKFGGEFQPTYLYTRDQTLLRQHDLKNFAMSAARAIYRRLKTSARITSLASGDAL